MTLQYIALCSVLISGAYSINVSSEALSVCSTDGFKCVDSCTKLIRCFVNGNNTYSQQVLRNCPSEIGKLCNLSTKDCSSYFCDDEKIDEQPINCYEDGIYPHPSDCKKYYDCAKGNSTIKTCPNDLAYNGLFGNCTTGVLEARPCQERPIPKCSSIDDIGPYLENSTVFYVCAYNEGGYLLPVLRRCESGFTFDSETKRCNSATVISLSFFMMLLSYLCIKA